MYYPFYDKRFVQSSYTLIIIFLRLLVYTYIRSYAITNIQEKNKSHSIQKKSMFYDAR